MAFLDKVKNWVSKNPDKAASAIDKAGDLFDQKTKGRYADKVHKAQDAAQDYVDKNKPQQPPAPPQAH
jgi:MT0933-like antitoxin protein